MKKPDWKTPLILSAILFVLGSFVYWLQFSHKPKKERTEAQTKKPLNFPAESDQIASFRIKSAAGLIEGKCESLSKKTCKVGATADWTITYPETLKGDGDNIRDYLNNASGMSAAETISLAEESPDQRSRILDEYGLSDPKRTNLNTSFLELTLENGKKITAWFGETHPIGDKIFVASAVDGKLNDETIFLVANFYRANLFDKNLTHFRDKSIFQFDRMDVESFTGKTPAGKLEGKLTNGAWEINGMSADQDRIGTMLSSIAQVKAKEFPKNTDWKGAKSTINFELRLKKGSPVRFELLTKAEGKPGSKAQPAPTRVFLRSPDLALVYEVESNLLVQTNKKRDELRRNLLLTQGEKVLITRMKLEGKAYKTPVEFNYEGSKWAQKTAEPKLDAGKVQGLIDQMATEHCPEIKTPAPAPKGDTLTVTMGDEKNPKKFSYQIHEADGKFFARDHLSRLNEAFLLPDSMKNSFPLKADSWKAK
ncbi:MAG: DUF4340 domain-containing protein [Bdellovibrionales bacterium]|nr:DUF4340 domain-containing protein [Bdellovibrionales bacterium]